MENDFRLFHSNINMTIFSFFDILIGPKKDKFHFLHNSFSKWLPILMPMLTISSTHLYKVVAEFLWKVICNQEEFQFQSLSMFSQGQN